MLKKMRLKEDPCGKSCNNFVHLLKLLLILVHCHLLVRWEYILHIRLHQGNFPAGIYLLIGDSGNFRTMYEICSKVTIKTRYSTVSIVDFK